MQSYSQSLRYTKVVVVPLNYARGHYCLFKYRVRFGSVAQYNLVSITVSQHGHQQYLYHVFIDFKKAFDRVWHASF